MITSILTSQQMNDPAGQAYALNMYGNNAHRAKWSRVGVESVNFYVNEQLSSEEKESLKNAGMPVFTVNRVTSIIEMMKYFVTANDPRWRIVGMEGSDSDMAHVHNVIAEYCWYISNGRSLYSGAILDSLLKGLGWLQVSFDANMDRGHGEVVFGQPDTDDVIVDPLTRDVLFRDAGWIQIHKRLPRHLLMAKLPRYMNKISAASSVFNVAANLTSGPMLPDDSQAVTRPELYGEISYDVTATMSDMLDYYETYSKIKVPFKYILIQKPPSQPEIQQIQNLVAIEMKELEQELAVQVREKELELQKKLEAGQIIPDRFQLEVKKLENQARDQIANARNERISDLIMAATLEQKYELSIKEYEIMLQKQPNIKQYIVNEADFYKTRIKLVCCVGNQTLYKTTLPISEYPLVPIPYLHVGTPYPVSAMLPMIGKQKEINKAHQIMIHHANLSSSLRWIFTDGAIDEEEWKNYASSSGALLRVNKGHEAPTPIMPQPINNAFYTIEMSGKTDLEFISGLPSSLFGDLSSSHETYRGMLANDEYGTRRIKSWVNNVIEPALELLGKVHQEYAQTMYTAHKVFRIVEPGADEMVKSVEINKPQYNTFAQQIGRYNDYQKAQFDTKIIPGATLPVNRWAIRDEYYKWFEGGLIDDIAMLEQTDITNKDQLVERKAKVNQLMQQVKQLGEQVDRDEQIKKQLENQVVQSRLNETEAKLTTRMTGSVLETEQQQKLLQGLMAGVMEQFEAKMDLAIEKKLIAMDRANQSKSAHAA